MSSRMPEFDRRGNHKDNYVRALFALGLLSEDAPGVTIAMAEHELSQRMLSFSLNGERTSIGRETYRESAFFYCLSQEKGKLTFRLDSSDIGRFCDFMTNAVLDTSDMHPGTQPVIDTVLEPGAEVEVEVALADER